MLEEKFTAHYCRHPFILAFDFKHAWNVWRRRCSHSQTVYNTAKSISPGNTYTEKLSQKPFHLHQSHFGFGRDEFFFFLNIVRSSNKFYRAKQRNLIFVQNCRVKNTVLSLEILGATSTETAQINPREINFYDCTSFRTPEIEHNKK